MKQPPPAHAMAPTRTVCIRQSCLAFRAGVRSSVGFAHGQPRSQGSRRRGRAGGRARAQNTEGRSQRVTTPAHIPSTPTQAAVPPTQAPSFQWPSLVIFQGVQQPRQDARAFPPSQLRRKRSPTRQALPSQQPSGRKVGQQPGTSTHARSPRPPRQAIAQCLVANAQLSATGSSTNLLHFACAGPRARGMHCFTQAMAYQ